MIVTITSLVPKNARNNPGIAAAIAPASAPKITHIGKRMIFGRSGKANAVQMLMIQPQSACPESPILKNPAEFATEKPKAVKIKGVACLNVSPILRCEPNEAFNMEEYPWIGW